MIIFGLSVGDVIAVSGLLIGAIAAWFKWLQTDKEKHKLTIEAEAEKERKKIEADVERDRIKAEAEVAKVKEQALGGEAVAKIWKECTSIQAEIQKLKEVQLADHSNDGLVGEIIKRLQEDVSRLMNAFFEKFNK